MIYRNKKKPNYDPINFEIFDDYSNWVLEDSSSFLIIEEVETLREDLASTTIQHISNDIDMVLVIVNYNFIILIYCYMSIVKLSKLILLKIN